MSDYEPKTPTEQAASLFAMKVMADRTAETWRLEAGKAWAQVKLLQEAAATEADLRTLDRRALLESLRELHDLINTLHEYDPDHAEAGGCNCCMMLGRACMILDEARAMREL